jgi:hypothetical protein
MPIHAYLSCVDPGPDLEATGGISGVQNRVTDQGTGGIRPRGHGESWSAQLGSSEPDEPDIWTSVFLIRVKCSQGVHDRAVSQGWMDITWQKPGADQEGGRRV